MSSHIPKPSTKAQAAMSLPNSLLSLTYSTTSKSHKQPYTFAPHTLHPTIFTSPPSFPHGPHPACVLSTRSKHSSITSTSLAHFYPELMPVSCQSTNSLPTYAQEEGLNGLWVWWKTVLGAIWRVWNQVETGSEGDSIGALPETGNEAMREYVDLPIMVKDEEGKLAKFIVQAHVLESEKEGITIGWGDMRRLGMTLLLRLMGENRTREGINDNRDLDAKDDRSGRSLVGGQKKLDTGKEKVADDVLIFGDIRIPVNIVRRFMS